MLYSLNICSGCRSAATYLFMWHAIILACFICVTFFFAPTVLIIYLFNEGCRQRKRRLDSRNQTCADDISSSEDLGPGEKMISLLVGKKKGFLS